MNWISTLIRLRNGNQDFVTIDAHPGIFNVTQLKTDVAKDLSVIGILKEQIALSNREGRQNTGVGETS